jgi:hypothetical protein
MQAFERGIVADGRFGAKPPSSPTAVLCLPAIFSTPLQRVEDLGAAAQRLGEAADAPTGRIMNSWKSIVVVGMHAAVDDVHHRHRQCPRRGCRRHGGTAACRRISAAAALAQASETAEDGVGAEAATCSALPSSSIIDLVESRPGPGRRCLVAACLAMGPSPLLAATAFCDALAEVPRLAFLRRTVAQLDRLMGLPVEAPEGTAATAARRHPSSTTSASTVGLPRLSRISRPMMSTMSVMRTSFGSAGGRWRCFYRNASRGKRPGDGRPRIG